MHCLLPVLLCLLGSGAAVPEGADQEQLTASPRHLLRGRHSARSNRGHGTRETQNSNSAQNASATPFLIRFALLGDPSEQLDVMQQAICTSETHLVPLLLKEPKFGVKPTYVVYVDHITEPLVVQKFEEWHLAQRVSIVNLDKDPGDQWRVGTLVGGHNKLNAASIRRALADTVHLPATANRMLLGTDITFVKDPISFVHQAASLGPGQAAYATDDIWGPYKLVSWKGPQCPGLLGDFIYLSAGAAVTTESLIAKMKWFMTLPRVGSRFSPPCESCQKASRGLHAMDQFAFDLALAEAVGAGGCQPLDNRYADHHRMGPTCEIFHGKKKHGLHVSCSMPA